MPSTTVNATLQGKAAITYSASLINWTSQVRDAIVGTSISTYTANATIGGSIRVYLISSRGGYAGHCSRVFLFFDGLDTATGGGTITAATLKVYNGSSSNSIDTIAVEATAWGGDGSTTTLASGDYSRLDQSTTYSSSRLSWSGAAYNDFTLNATAITAMNNDGYLNVAVIDNTYDQGNTSPSLNSTSDTATVNFNNPSNPIKLELTYSAAGYSNKVLGVSSATIAKINGVATADIAEVLGVS